MLVVVIFLVVIGTVGYLLFVRRSALVDRKELTENAKDSVETSSLKLDFFAGGSIFGSNFEVKITDESVTYRETRHLGKDEVKKFHRNLTDQELNTIMSVIHSTGLTVLNSQDFTEDPLVPDQGYYKISLFINDKKTQSIVVRPYQGNQKQNVRNKFVN